MATSPEYLNDARFSQTFVAQPSQLDPANDQAKPFTVTYADFGYRNEAHPEQENVLLFFGPLLGSRWIHVVKDALAKRHKIRFINPDRPGFGGTDEVDAKHGLVLWRAAIVALLSHLKVQGASVACHSGGTIYALDFLLHHPELLHPERPYLAIGAPWILPARTGSITMSITNALPGSLIGQMDKISSLINNYIGPAIGTSAQFGLASIASILPSSPAAAQPDGSAPLDDAVLERQLWNAIIDRVYSENMHGMSADAVFFMGKADGARGWGDWGDYDALVPRLREALQRAGRTLQVDVFYAESDSLIGDGQDCKGARWFDECWNASRCGEAIKYRSAMVKGADHNAIWDLRWGAVREMFERVEQAQAPAVEQSEPMSSSEEAGRG